MEAGGLMSQHSIGEGDLPDQCEESSVRIAPKVLLVDDDPAVRASLKFSFELEGFEVEDFADAESFSEQAQPSDNACLVIDYRLPGMNGLALLALLRARGVCLPAIIITSNPTRSVRQAVADANADLVEKPLLCDALTASIRSLIVPKR